MSIYKDCDIRGIYAQDLTEEIMGWIGSAVGATLQGRTIVVGGDYRTHTPVLKQALIDALVKCGAKVMDVGQVSTPQLYFSKRYLGTYASAQVTASHNPAKYNGVKLMFGDLPVQPEDIRKIETLAQQASQGEKLWDGVAGSCEKTDTTSAYMDMLGKIFGGIKKPLHVVVDAGNGAMSEVAPAMLEKLGVTVTRLFCEYDGTFPGRDPNPAVAAHLCAVREKVKEVHADFGAAFDGDGDRVIFIDANGDVLMAEEAMVLFVRYLAHSTDSVVYDQKSSGILKAAILEKGAKPIMERSGHAFIRRTFMQESSVFAGEVSGHYFFRDLAGDDGLYALVLMLNIVGNSDRSMREMLSEITYPCITPDIRVHADEASIAQALDRMEQWAKEPDVCEYRIDGIRLEFPDGSWVLLRRSVTEPAFTMRIEAPDQMRLDEILTECERRIGYPKKGE